MDFMLIAVIVLGAIALVAAAVLYVCSKKFAVKEDPEDCPGVSRPATGQLWRMWISGMFGYGRCSCEGS